MESYPFHKILKNYTPVDQLSGARKPMNHKYIVDVPLPDRRPTAIVTDILPVM